MTLPEWKIQLARSVGLDPDKQKILNFAIHVPAIGNPTVSAELLVTDIPCEIAHKNFELVPIEKATPKL